MWYCDCCDKKRKELLKTAYGEYLCEDCWDDYINTSEGRLEYLIGICNGDYPASDFDADFLFDVSKSWMLHRDKLDLDYKQKLALENRARKLGIL